MPSCRRLPGGQAIPRDDAGLSASTSSNSGFDPAATPGAATALAHGAPPQPARTSIRGRAGRRFLLRLHCGRLRNRLHHLLLRHQSRDVLWPRLRYFNRARTVFRGNILSRLRARPCAALHTILPALAPLLCALSLARCLLAAHGLFTRGARVIPRAAPLPVALPALTNVRLRRRCRLPLVCFVRAAPPRIARHRRLVRRGLHRVMLSPLRRPQPVRRVRLRVINARRHLDLKTLAQKRRHHHLRLIRLRGKWGRWKCGRLRRGV
jgi:hypothetical protein